MRRITTRGAPPLRFAAERPVPDSGLQRGQVGALEVRFQSVCSRTRHVDDAEPLKRKYVVSNEFNTT